MKYFKYPLNVVITKIDYALREKGKSIVVLPPRVGKHLFQHDVGELTQAKIGVAIGAKRIADFKNKNFHKIVSEIVARYDNIKFTGKNIKIVESK